MPEEEGGEEGRCNDNRPRDPGLAKSILDADPFTLEINAKKLLVAFPSDFHGAAATGCISNLGVYVIALGIKMWAWSDAQELEGMSSLVRINCNRAPSISLPLLSARLGAKKAMGIGAKGSNLRFNTIKPKAASVIDQCSLWPTPDASAAIMSSTSRWESVRKCEYPYVLPACAAEAKDASTLWKTAYNILWHRACSKPDFKRCWSFGEIVMNGDVYLCAEKQESWHDGPLRCHRPR